jgi:deoxycytidylate deaminase
MKPKIRSRLITLALSNPGVAGKFKVAAGLVHRGRLIATGVNSYKTHLIMLNGSYCPGQIHLHAEAACLVSASSILPGTRLYVVRVKRGPMGRWVTGNAKPCPGCMGLIENYGITQVRHTIDGERV